MKKNLLFIVGISIVSLVFVVGFIFLQTSGLKKTITIDTENAYRLHNSISQVDESTKKIQILVAESFLTKIIDDVEFRENLVNEELTRVTQSLKDIKSSLTEETQKIPLEVTLAETPTKFTILEAEEKIESFYGKLGAEIQGLFKSRKDQIDTLKNMTKERGQLSKIYRDSQVLSKLDENVFKKISRAVLTVLFSNSNGELNFAGRTIFEDAAKEIATKKMSKEQSEKWQALSAQFFKTYEVAFKASSFANDFEIFNQNLKEPTLLATALRELSKNQFHQSKESAVATTDKTRSISVGVGILAILLSLFAGWLVSQKMLRELGGMMKTLSKTNLDITSASTSLTGTSTELSSGATKTAASLEETLSSLTEISSIVQTNANSAQSSFDLARETLSTASDGKEKVEKLASSILGLSQVSRQIGEIVTMIDEIAFQTNLLALNAAVEAARAGEHGKGFAIVAEAVRSLAMKSAGAAKEISGLIRSTSEQIESGVLAAQDSQKVLVVIVSQVEKVKEASEAIAVATREQAAGIEQINSSLNNLDQVSQTNALSARKTAEDSEGLTAQSENLSQVVRDLEKLVGNAA